MPIHDWTRVAAGIFHHLHHEWISEIARTLNKGLLPRDYYALAEQTAAGFGPDVLALQARFGDADFATDNEVDAPGGGATATLTRPSASITAQTDEEFYRRKKSSVVVRHVSDDRIVAIVEIVSPGNKASRHPFLDKVADFLEFKVRLLVIDLLPPTPRDPQGIHNAIWNEVAAQEFIPPLDKPLTLATYESGPIVRAFVEPVAVGDVLPNMPLPLEFDGAVSIPLEETYRRAFELVPDRWRRVIEG